jgi:hypothetical protein
MLGCANSPPPEPTTSVAAINEPAATPAPRAPTFGGTYALSSSSGVAKECGGQLMLAAKHIEVNQGTGAVYADVVNRTYKARFDGATMIADGTFDVAGTCPGTKVYEKWTLTRDETGTLRGELESHWQLPPYCQRACEVRFPITATPA